MDFCEGNYCGGPGAGGVITVAVLVPAQKESMKELWTTRLSRTRSIYFNLYLEITVTVSLLTMIFHGPLWRMREAQETT